MRNAYCKKIGVEYMHIADKAQCHFIRGLFELEQYKTLDNQERIKLLDRLLWTDEFATFISNKFNTMKRFGLEGVESFIPGLKSAIDEL